MKNRLRIFYLAAEVAPFAKTGSLAEVARAIPKALFEDGHDVRVMMPKYGIISERRYVLREVIRLKQIPITMGEAEHVVSVKSAFLPDTKVQVYFLDYKPFFDRPELYVDPKTGKDYPDNAQRFFLFCKAVLATIKLLHWEPHVIHCNDWQTAMIPWLLHHEYRNDPFFSKVLTVLTIHDMAYQGAFDAKVLAKLGIDAQFKETGSDLECNNKINFLKAGIVHADVISTVSPSYALEIQKDADFGCGLQGVLEKRCRDIHGILNGVDYSVWNPELDAFIPQKYNSNTLHQKIPCKQALLQQANLPYDAATPVIGMITRLEEQKGLELVAEAMEPLAKLPIRLLIVGSGEAKYQKMLEKLAKKYARQLAVQARVDEPLSHLLIAGSDMLLIPPRIEPCGLYQMYALKYGTIPIVYRTGGLADTVLDYDEDEQHGNGFVFQSYTAEGLVDAVNRAVRLYKDEAAWQKLVKRAMKQDFSWQLVADRYVKLYQKLENQKRKK